MSLEEPSTVAVSLASTGGETSQSRSASAETPGVGFRESSDYRQLGLHVRRSRDWLSSPNGPVCRKLRRCAVDTFPGYYWDVPEISRFLGIVIALFYRDHAPPHFHAIYGEYHVTVEIETGLVDGRFPRRALQHVLEWHGLHKQELHEDWELSRNLKPLRPVAPLE